MSYNLTVSYGFGSYNFNTNDFGYLGEEGNTGFQNFGYGLGALANASDLYKFSTWDILGKKKQLAKLQKEVGDYNVKYDPNLNKSAQYNPTNNSITFGKEGLKRGLGWAKSTYQHEHLHMLDNITQPNVPQSISSQGEYISFLEKRAYTLELKNSFQNRLTLYEHQWIRQKVIEYSGKANLPISNLPKYKFSQFFLSLFR